VLLIVDYNNNAPNTPAADHWTLQFQYVLNNDTYATPCNLPITFNSTGAVDFTRTSVRDWQAVNDLLSPINLLTSLAGLLYNIELDVWQLINWFFISHYWGVLADLGQDSPTIYPPTTHSARGFYPPDFSNAIRYSPTNNIFVNNTLFSIYSVILRNQIFALLNTTLVSTFAPLDDENCFKPVNRSFQRNYSCVERRWKTPLTAFISILVAAYALIKTGYSLFIFIAAWFQKKGERKGPPFLN